MSTFRDNFNKTMPPHQRVDRSLAGRQDWNTRKSLTLSVVNMPGGSHRKFTAVETFGIDEVSSYKTKRKYLGSQKYCPVRGDWFFVTNVPSAYKSLITGSGYSLEQF